ncbi:MAG: hypothetical protein LBE24_10610 [Methylobacillus sp.]|jgi:hypothetical protein|nr:hypothetical protein [Methylobacillus sp.]
MADPFKEQLEFFRNKLNLPSERWDDIWEAAHDRAFIVAGAMKADLINDLRRAVDKGISQGLGLGEFRRDFKQIVFNHGWTGWTGEGSKAGFAWRTRVTYRTNMAMSYSAGRYEQMTDPEYLKLRPLWRYKHGYTREPNVPRMNHLSWDGVTLMHDHPFWKTHWAPNGFECSCWVIAVDPWEKIKEPPVGWDKIDPKTGQMPGIMPGFGYAPGANVKTQFREFIDKKLIRLDAPIGAELWKVLEPVLRQERQDAVRDLVTTTAASMRSTNAAVVVHALTLTTINDLKDKGVQLNDAAIWLRDHEFLHAIREKKANRGATIPLEVWEKLPEYLDTADPYWDTEDPGLVFGFDLPDKKGKVAVNVNHASKVRIAGVRHIVRSNFIATGGLIDERNLSDKRYVPLKK